MNLPQTHEGRQVWDLVQHLDGQVRLSGMGGLIGYDMTAALAMARALGVDEAAVAVLLPEVEAAMVRKVREQMESANG